MEPITKNLSEVFPIQEIVPIQENIMSRKNRDPLSDIHWAILKEFDIPGVLLLGQTSKYWKRQTNNNKIWNHFQNSIQNKCFQIIVNSNLLSCFQTIDHSFNVEKLDELFPLLEKGTLLPKKSAKENLKLISLITKKHIINKLDACWPGDEVKVKSLKESEKFKNEILGNRVIDIELRCRIIQHYPITDPNMLHFYFPKLFYASFFFGYLDIFDEENWDNEIENHKTLQMAVITESKNDINSVKQLFANLQNPGLIHSFKILLPEITALKCLFDEFTKNQFTNELNEVVESINKNNSISFTNPLFQSIYTCPTNKMKLKDFKKLS